MDNARGVIQMRNLQLRGISLGDDTGGGRRASSKYLASARVKKVRQVQYMKKRSWRLKTESQRCKRACRCASLFLNSNGIVRPQGSTVVYPSCGGGDGLEIGPAGVDKVSQDIGPIVPFVP